VNSERGADRGEVDEVLGIVRCARCGHRLQGEIECPFCCMFPDEIGRASCRERV